jgi:uncharacterized protein
VRSVWIEDWPGPVMPSISNFFIVGSGTEPWVKPEPLRARFREAHVSVDTMTTGPAVRTYNVMLIEGRRVGAGLIAID